MKKAYMLEELDCAMCAAKIEDNIKKIKGVKSASVSFIAQKLILDADENSLDEILKQAAKICKRIEPNCKIILQG